MSRSWIPDGHLDHEIRLLCHSYIYFIAPLLPFHAIVYSAIFVHVCANAMLYIRSDLPFIVVYAITIMIGPRGNSVYRCLTINCTKN